ncbi:MAG: acetyl-CoA acetyltransferase [Deltaproteobacteria bacterium RIFCSPHIGHO2_02_FULL_60_17]|nr:MAG: acetyl-CoA acetyltransferase [Deltaproteobacteria bacterium RIFCSPHIGHO2_02_FULL_60_17]
MKEAVIVSAVRTPIGSFHGALSPLAAPALGSIVIAEALRRVSLGGDGVNEVVMGNVLSAGLGQAPARQAALGAGLAKTVGCTTINKVCGSGLKAVMLAAQAIQLGQAEVVVAGGMESMSNAPYLLDKARGGYRMGNGTLVDSLIKDGLWDVYNDFHMGAAAELCAERFKITREEQDEFAILSYQRAQAAQRLGHFKKEIAPVKISRKQNQSTVVEEDEEVQKFDGEKMRRLQPAFRAGGTVTAGNASSVSDGAAALVVMAREKAQRLGIQPLVRIVGYAASAREPEWFSIAPIEAISSLLQSTGCRLADVDLAEINEAFAVSSIAVHREVGLDPEKVNVRGGAIALGHPIGASGARILTTLIHALADLGKKRGIAALCIGGGEGVAMLVERI